MASVAALVAVAVALAWPAPRVMARMTTFCRATRAALVVWQSVSLAAVISALAVGPAVLPQIDGPSAGSGSARALVVLAASDPQTETMGAGGSSARLRLDLLPEATRPRVLLSLLMFGLAALVLGAPIALVIAGRTTS